MNIINLIYLFLLLVFSFICCYMFQVLIARVLQLNNELTRLRQMAKIWTQNFPRVFIIIFTFTIIFAAVENKIIVKTKINRKVNLK